jgi:hypothetical protein
MRFRFNEALEAVMCKCKLIAEMMESVLFKILKTKIFSDQFFMSLVSSTSIEPVNAMSFANVRLVYVVETAVRMNRNMSRASWNIISALGYLPDCVTTTFVEVLCSIWWPKLFDSIMRVRMTENNETTVELVKHVFGFMPGSIFMISEEYEFEGKINEVGSVVGHHWAASVPTGTCDPTLLVYEQILEKNGC